MSLDINLTNVESTTNKSTNVNTDQASNTKYPSVKAVFDWATSLFIKKSDYTPAHSILAQQSGTGSPTAVTIGTNEILGRLSGGGADIKGLSASEVKSILNFTSSELFEILGVYQYQINTASALVTTTSPTIVGNIPIPAGTYSASGGKFEFNMYAIKTSAIGQITIEAYVGPTSNNLAGATRIATSGAITLNARYAPFRRKSNFDGTNIVGLNFGSGNANDDTANSTVPGSLAFDRTIDNYLMFVITLGSASDNAYLQFAEFKNF